MFIIGLSLFSECCNGDVSTFTKRILLGKCCCFSNCFRIKPVPPPRSTTVWGWFVWIASVMTSIKGDDTFGSEKYPLCMVFHLLP